MSLAFNEPDRIDTDFADPPEVAEATVGHRHSDTMETEKWW